jgi:NADH dehydrogenase
MSITGIVATGFFSRRSLIQPSTFPKKSAGAFSLGRHAGNNIAAQLLNVAPVPYSQPKYVTCLDLGAWGAVYTEGWDRQVKLVGAEAKALKTQINTQWIYPPVAKRDEALAAADPMIPVVA